jgi:uncharacterized repeat protein (TIGR03803 family)
MVRQAFLPFYGSLLAILLALLLAVDAFAAGPHYRVLYRFLGTPDGSEPYAGLTMDAAGNLYGTTYIGGTEGTVYRLAPGANNDWIENVLFDFSDPSVSGGFPIAGVTLDAAGNVYGASEPGAGNQGVVYELTPNSSGFWNVNVLHTFSGDKDGGQPWAAPIFDKAGNLYGTATNGPIDPRQDGMVYQLALSHGMWHENIFPGFSSKKDGAQPSAELVFDKAANLYSTTTDGGTGCRPVGCGTVFKMSNTNGHWTETVIYAFKGGADGAFPSSALVRDKAGNLYGTTAVGGIGPCDIESTPGCGTVFKLTPDHKSRWKKTLIYSPDGSAGGGLFGGLVFDKAGNLYGTTTFYGKTSKNCPAGCGSVFKLTPGTKRRWTATTLYEFRGTADGGEPSGRLLLDQAGNIFGTTEYGGNSTYPCNIYGCGVVFEIRQN